jgi:hypothetical protein
MKTINIKGKPYIPVNERLKHFRQSKKYEDWAISEEIISFSESEVLVKVSLIDENGVCKSIAHSQEFRDNSMINKTSFLENAFTSALGRALGYLGIGIDTSIASYNEVNQAVKKQEVFQRRKLTPQEFKNTLQGTKDQAVNVMAKFQLTDKQKQELIQKFQLNGK